MTNGDINLVHAHAEICIQLWNFPLVYMFSAGQSHILIHIHETVGNLGLGFDTIVPPFPEWVMCFESKL